MTLPQPIHDALLANETLLLWLAATSVLTFIASLVIVPFLIVHLPVDYFSHGKRHPAPWSQHHPLMRGIFLVGKNILGVIILMGGVLMLFLPGQGLLTILLALVLLDIPGKYRFERWLISKPAILRGLNWLRQRNDHPPLRIIDKDVDI